MLPAPKRFEKRPGSALCRRPRGDDRRADGSRRRSLSAARGASAAPARCLESADGRHAERRDRRDGGAADRRGRHGVRRREAARRAAISASTRAPATARQRRDRRRGARLPRRSSAPTPSRPSWPRCARIAAIWMERLAAFRPHLTGAVWRGTATRLSDIHHRAVLRRLEGGRARADRPARRLRRGQHRRPARPVLDVLNCTCRARRSASGVTSHLTVLDYDDLRGALKPRRARPQPQRGDLAALRALRGRRHEPAPRSSLGAGSPRWRPAPARRCARGASTRRTPRRAECRVDIWALRFETPDGGQLAHGELARQAAAAQLLGDLVRALRRRNAAARSLRTRAARRRLAGRGHSPSTRPMPVRKFVAERTGRLPVALAGAIGARACRASSATPAAGCRSASAFDAAGASSAQARRRGPGESLSSWAGVDERRRASVICSTA